MIPIKGFSYKLALVGAIVGMSIGLGDINVGLGISLAFIFAAIFGFKSVATKNDVKQVQRRT